ncbi:hypothetical protein HMP0721_0490 [Pseudoramibacter alactolyticus ATCC 23263]|uniref:Uncharacterized protein n=2 Tax=Pseudoramibacter TaxID=113286 RepID=E6MEQ7_9FIRM|nr:hypothetical protein HMP0721_0490 [Pseudoramibacter alactolyticus ATCC 23263]
MYSVLLEWKLHRSRDETMIEIERNTLMEMPVMPLYGRAVCLKRYSDIFKDGSAEQVIGNIHFDFSQAGGRSVCYQRRHAHIFLYPNK